MGFSALLSRAFGWQGAAPILLPLGAAFFTISALSGFRGPLLPAGILLGLGVGFLLRAPLEPWVPGWASLLLGLGSGFLLVAAIDRTRGRRREPPPLVPGLILTGIALVSAAGSSEAFRDLFVRLEPFWPVALIGAGILLLVASRRKGSV